MKILLAHNNYAIRGGAEVFYHETGRILTKNGHDVAFFSAEDTAVKNAWSEYFPRAVDYSAKGINRIMSYPRTVYSRESKKKMASLIRDFRPDLVHVFAIYVKLTPSILDACREACVPVVISCNDYKLICPNYKLFHHKHLCEDCYRSSYYMAMVNRCCHGSFLHSAASAVEAYAHKFMDSYKKNVHTFLFASEFMAKKTAEFWGRDSFRWRMLRNPFDSTRYRPSYDDDGYFLYFGRLIEEKGVDVLITAMREIPETKLCIVGNGPQETSLRQLCKDLKLQNVEFVGPKWGADLDALLARCRFVVLPSIWHENFPYVINQSFAMGKAVIGSNRGGIPELIKDGERGIIYNALDSGALAAAIRTLWCDRDKARTMGSAAKTFADREYNDFAFYSQLMSIYSEVLR